MIKLNLTGFMESLGKPSSLEPLQKKYPLELPLATRTRISRMMFDPRMFM